MMVDVVDDYHGTRVADPYRWLEDSDSPVTRAWLAAQQEQTERFLAGIPARARTRRRLTELWDYPRYSVPERHGDRYFFFKNDGLQNQAVLYRQDGLDGTPAVVIDPNLLSPDGTVALSGSAPDRRGSLLAYAVSASGSDWQEWRIRDVATGQDLPEMLRWCKFSSIAWTHDGSGFYYNRLPEPGSVPEEDQNNYSRVYWHAVGTPQASDTPIFELPEAKELQISPQITEDGRYLLLYISQGTSPKNRLYYRPLAGEEGPFIRLLDEADAHYGPLDVEGTTLYLLTDFDAPRRRVVAVDLDDPARERWREIVPQTEDTIEDVAVVHGHFVAIYLHDAHHRVRLFDRRGGQAGDIALPDLGSIDALSGKPDDTELFLGFSSFLHPGTILRYDFTSRALSILRSPELQFDGAAYQTRQVFYTSKDGTRVPMFLIHRRDLVLDGTSPTILYGYGGFNISLSPFFSVSRLVWLESGGVLAIANLRGGGEYGEAWHEAGMLHRKQNVFDDFIAAAEWLIASGYTSTPRLAIQGGSNGGLLVAACMLQRPDLFGAVLCQVPVLDMLRYHRFTLGAYWIPEYGNADEDPAAFRTLYAYSPLHNIRPGTAYPPILITTADTDDRVVPAHARKFTAALQAAQAGPNPVLLRVETRAGHGAGKPTAKLIEEQSDLYAFLSKVLGVQVGGAPQDLEEE